MPKKKSNVKSESSPAPQLDSSENSFSADVPSEVSEWFESGRIAVLNSIEERSGNSLKDRKKTEDAKTRLKDLSTGSDVVGVSFAGDPLQHLYYSTKFERRGILLYAIMSRLLGDCRPSRADLVECRKTLQPLLTRACGRPTLNAASIGGGPVSTPPPRTHGYRH